MSPQEATLTSLANEIDSTADALVEKAGLFGVLHPQISDEFSSSIADLQSRLSAFAQAWIPSPGDSPADQAYVRTVLIPYFESTLASSQAQVELSRAGTFRPSNRSYELHLQREALSIADVANVVDVYHATVNAFLNAQKDLRTARFERVFIENEDEYRRQCEMITGQLDEHATALFGSKIHTPANVDLKERNPHQFLQRINLGYEGYRASLIRLISHEGPFGHNTHQSLSHGKIFSSRFVHQLEGIAIMGEGLGFKAMYARDGVLSDGAAAVSNLLLLKRRVTDSLGAAFEKLAFHDRLSAQQIAEMLASAYAPKQWLEQNFNGLDNRRETSFQFGATPYFVGYEIVRDIQGSALSRIESLPPQLRAQATNTVYRALYKGHRPARVMGAHVNILLDDVASASAQSKTVQSELDVSNGYRS